MLRRILLPIIALAVAAGTVFYAKNFLDTSSDAPTSQPAVVETQRSRQVLVALEAVTPGSFLQENQLDWQDWPDVDLPETYFVDEEVAMTDLTAAVTRRGLSAGEPLTEGNVVFPGERGFLAAVLRPGTRAVSVPINETSSNAGMILPGDRIDLILTQALTDSSGGRERWVSETVLEDARIIAMGRRLQHGSDDASAAVAADAKTATLEVSPREAELVALVTDLGRLTLSLRSLSAPDTTSEESGDLVVQEWPMDAAPPLQVLSTPGQRVDPFTRDSDISQSLRREDEAQDALRVVRGPEQQLLELEHEPAQ